MAVTLSFGFINPASGDAASIWQAAINSTIAQLAIHNHNGTNSSTVSPASISVLTSSVNNANWVESPALSGNYNQTITAPAAVSEVNNFYPKIYRDSDGGIVYISVTRVAANQILLETNNPVDMTVVWR